jgi:hypothetical protein
MEAACDVVLARKVRGSYKTNRWSYLADMVNDVTALLFFC